MRDRTTYYLASFEAFALSVFVILVAMSTRSAQFVTDNHASSWTRVLFLVVPLAAAVGVQLAVRAKFARAARSDGRLALWVERLRPALVLWVLPPLLVPGVFKGNETFLMLLTCAVVVGTEWVARSQVPNAIDADARPVASRTDTKSRLPTLVVTLLIASMFAFACFGSIRIHHKMLTSNLDFALFENLFWNALQGRHGIALEYPYFAEHAEFFLYVLLPIYAAFPHSETLFVLQSGLVVGAAVPLFLLARRWLRAPWQAVAIAGAYLAFPTVHGALFYDFHFLPLSAFFLLWCAFFYAKRRFIEFWVFVVLAMSCREDVAAGLAAIGLGLVIVGRTRKVGWGLATLGTAWFVVVKLYWMERFGSQIFSGYYAELIPKEGGGFLAVLQTLITNPIYTLSRTISEQKLVLALHLLTPLALLPVRQRRTAFLLLPGLLIVGLSTSKSAITEFQFHYSMHFVPYLFVATTVALAVRSRRSRAAALSALLVGTLIAAVQYSAFFGPTFRTSFHRVSFDWTEADRERAANFAFVARKIPKNAALSAGEHEGPQLGRRDKLITLKDDGVKGVEYVIYSKRSLRWGGDEHVEAALSSGAFGVLATRGDITLLRRGADTKKNERALRMLSRKH